MKLVQGEGIDWGTVRELLGAQSEEVELSMAEDLAAMEAMTHEPGSEIGTDWNLIDIEEGASEEEQEALAALSAMSMRHANFDHIQPGIWNHPLNLNEKAITQVLGSLGFMPIQSGTVNAVGRVIAWP